MVHQPLMIDYQSFLNELERFAQDDYFQAKTGQASSENRLS
jgi:hypothetical protein